MTTIDNELGENLTILAQLMCDVCQPRLLAQASPVPLSRNQFALLKLLHAKPTYKVGELARMLSISGAATSKNVDRLETLGLVKRLAKPGDRRGLDVVLLPRGRAVVDEYARISEMKHAAQFGQFTLDDKERLLTGLRRIIRATLAQESSPDMICLLCEGHGASTCAVRESKGNCLRVEGQ
jgi:DNA-binding MarR family transcriptional regulator